MHFRLSRVVYAGALHAVCGPAGVHVLPHTVTHGEHARERDPQYPQRGLPSMHVTITLPAPRARLRTARTRHEPVHATTDQHTAQSTASRACRACVQALRPIREGRLFSGAPRPEREGLERRWLRQTRSTCVSALPWSTPPPPPHIHTHNHQHHQIFHVARAGAGMGATLAGQQGGGTRSSCGRGGSKPRAGPWRPDGRGS